MEKTQGYIPSIHERPPHYWYALVNFVADGDVLKHRAIRKQPLFLVLSYAEQKAKEAFFAEQKQKALEHLHQKNTPN